MATFRPATASFDPRRLLGPLLVAVLVGGPIHGADPVGSVVVAVASLAITPASVLPGETARVELLFETTAPVGAYSVDIQCDSNLFSIEAVRGGTTAEFSAPPFRNVSACSARLSAFQIASLVSPTGTVSVARIELRVHEDALPTLASVVDLTVRSLDDTSAAAIDVVDVDGQIDVDTLCGNGLLDEGEDCDDGDPWVAGQWCGLRCTIVGCADPNDSGQVTASDALFTLRSAVGLATCAPCVCDVDASGGPLAASDALRVLQFSTGASAALTCSVCP